MYTHGIGTAITALALTSLAGNCAAGPVSQSIRAYSRDVSTAPSTDSSSPNLVPVKAPTASTASVDSVSDGDSSGLHQPSIDLLKSGAWHWAKSSEADPMGIVTGNVRSENELYLDMERFDNVVQNIHCTDTGVSFSFKDQNLYNSAKSAWNWVNSDGNTILFVVNQPNCGADDNDRQPYNATKATFGDNLSVQFEAVEAQWSDGFLGDWEISFGASVSGDTGASNGTVNSKRGQAITNPFQPIDGQVTVSLEKDLSRPIVPSIDIGSGVSLEVDCESCRTSGALNLHLVASAKDGVQFTISQPQGQQLGADFTVAFVAKGSLTKEISQVFAFPPIPLGSLPKIAGIVDIGPSLNFQANLDISKIEAQVALKVGGTLSIDPSAKTDLNILHPGSSTSSNWTPSFSAHTPSIDGSVSVHGSVSPQVALELDFKVLNMGLTGGIALVAPRFDMTAEAAFSTAGDGTVCGTDAKAGASLEVGVAAEVDVFGGFTGKSPLDQNNLPNKKPVFSTSTQLFSTCLTIGGSAPSSPTPEPSNQPGDQPNPATTGIPTGPSRPDDFMGNHPYPNGTTSSVGAARRGAGPRPTPMLSY